MRHQSAMKAELFKFDAVFKSKTVLNKLCPADPNIVDAVIVDLKNIHGISYDNLQYPDFHAPGQPMVQWPGTKEEERRHYEPFAWLLNVIMSSSLHMVDIKSLDEKLSLSPYDRTMAEGMQGDLPLKPGLVGCKVEILLDDHHVSWKHLKISSEVKSRWPSIISQASTYTPCCLTFQENKSFPPVIHFHYVSMEFRMGFYTRSGLSITKAFAMSTPDGFRNLVRAMVGMYSWTNPSSAGIDSHTNAQIVIPKLGISSIAKVYYNRRCIRGQANQIDQLEKGGKSTFSSGHIQLRTKCGTPADKLALSGIPASPLILDPVTRPAPMPALNATHCNLWSSQHHRLRPHAGVGKTTSALGHLSFHLDGSPTTRPPRARRKGGDGEPPVHPTPQTESLRLASDGLEPHPGSSHTIHPLTTAAFPDVNPSISPANDSSHYVASEWDVDRDRDPISNPSLLHDPKSFRTEDQLGAPGEYPSVGAKDSWSMESHANESQLGQNVHAKPKRRIHKCIVLKTRAIPLLDAQGPRCLVEGIVHAILGHYLMFKDGWLHRDVSPGNVMLMKEESRSPVEDFKATKKLTQCTGFILDGDQAVLWKENDRELATRRSGTLPFMSLNLIDSWSIGEQTPHTAIDDLESFIWVLLWSILSIMEQKDALVNPRERDYLNILRSGDLNRLQNRTGILDHLERQQATHSFSKGLAPFIPLLIPWLQIAKHAAFEILAVPSDADALEAYSRTVYEKYIEAGLELEPKLQERWD